MGMSSLDVLSMAAVIAAYWHCSHSMESGVYVTVQCLSVCLFQHEPTAANLLYAAAGLLLWAGVKEISIDCCIASTQQQQ